MWAQYKKLWDVIMQLLSARQWVELSVEAMEDYCRQALIDPQSFDQVNFFKFYEWFLWDYRVPTANGGQTRMSNCLLQALPKELTSEERYILNQWEAIVVQISQVISVELEDVLMYDCLTGEHFSAVKWRENLLPGDIFISRWLPMANGYRIPSPALIMVPGEVYPFLHKRIQGEFRRYQGDVEEFYRDYGYKFEIWMWELLGSQPQASSVLFEVLNFRQVLKTLKKQGQFRLSSSKVVNLFGPLEFDWVVDHQIKARIVVDQDELMLASDDYQVILRGKALLSHSFNHCLEFVDEFVAEEIEENPKLTEFVDSLPWPRSRDWEVAKLLECHMDFYRDEQVVNAIRMWNDFCQQALPNYRKPAVWAAAVELAVGDIDAIHISPTELEDKYQVSATSIIKGYKELKTTLELVIGDWRYSSI